MPPPSALNDSIPPPAPFLPSDPRIGASLHLTQLARFIRRMTVGTDHDGYGPQLRAYDLWPDGSRVMAACWRIDTRAVALPSGDGWWRFHVPTPVGDVPVGRLRLISGATAVGLWWRCRTCRLGADGCASTEAGDHEQARHEMICPGVSDA